MSRTTHEVRWFLPEDERGVPRPRGRGRKRVDLYHADSLAASSALKLRGGARLEMKRRLDWESIAVEVGGCPGVVERWVKQRPDAAVDVRDTRGWIAVAKERWDSRTFEVARLTIASVARPWWTIAVRHDRMPAAATDPRFHEWTPLLHGAVSTGFPGWIAEVGGGSVHCGDDQLERR